MKTVRHHTTLWAPSGTLAVDTLGTAFRWQPDSSGQVDEFELDARFVIRHTHTGGATSPTSQLVILHSADGVNWVTALAGTQRSADGTYTEVLDSTSIALLPYVRASLDVGGGTAPNCTNVSVEMCSNSPIQLLTP